MRNRCAMTINTGEACLAPTKRRYRIGLTHDVPGEYVQVIGQTKRTDNMDENMIGICGAYCGACEWKPKVNCPGCQAAKGKMFWGQCQIATCSLGKGFAHCGQCPDVPCGMLKAAFDDPEHGDSGERLLNLKAWARGEDTWLELRNPKKADG
jgi:hypothetical protein